MKTLAFASLGVATFFGTLALKKYNAAKADVQKDGKPLRA